MNSKPLTLEDLRITLNGTFVRTREDVDDGHINRIVDAARANEDSEQAALLEVHREQVGNAKISALVFYSTRDAYFVPDGDLYDTIASYIIVVETGARDLVVFKKSCGTLTPLLEADFDVVDYSELINSFDDSRTMIQKLSTREMSVSDKGIRARSYEAADLKGHMSPHAAGRSIPRFTQVRSKDEVRSISLTTGRINQLTDRVSVAKAADWAKATFELMAKTKVNKTFFSTFAQRVSLQDVLKHARPASILFERSSIEDHLTEEKVELWYIRKGQGKYQRLKPASLKRLLNSLDTAFEVDDNGKIVGTRGSKLQINKKTISPQTVALKRLKIKHGKDYITFQSWITDHGHFIVSFDKPEYIYLKKSCFQDRAGRSEVDSILKCLHPAKGFASATSEKGEPQNADTKFSINSLFYRVEQIHAADDYIFCDDFGNEWADHLTINLKSACVSFIHSKHAKSASNSASALHEVVGQAVKNLGNMHFNLDTFSRKATKFKGRYKGTLIERTRRGDLKNLNSDIKQLLADHRLHRKCIVACSTLSKKLVETEFAKMKSGARVRGNVTQLFWILSSFIHAAQGSSSVPIVYCRP